MTCGRSGGGENHFTGARAHGVGVGWVSILDPEEVRRIVEAPAEWKLISYLCVGFPVEEHDLPELVRAGWESGRS